MPATSFPLPESLVEYRRELGNTSFYYANATSALKDILRYRKRQQGPGRTVVLLPSYICANVVSAVRAVGLDTVFYPVDRECRVDPKTLHRLCDGTTLAILWVHFFGIPSSLAWLQNLGTECGAMLIEDCAHVLAGRVGEVWTGTTGDVALYSLWKTMRSADGALLLLKSGFAGDFVPGYDRKAGEGPALQRTLAASIKSGMEALLGRPVPRPRAEPTPPFPLDLQSARKAGVSAMSRFSRVWLEQQNIRRIVEARRSNFVMWAESINRFQFLDPLIPHLDEGWVPYSFPVQLEGRDDLRLFLWRHGIACGAGFPEAPFVEGQEGASLLSTTVLELPVHQSFARRDFEYACGLLSRWHRRFDSPIRKVERGASR